MQTTTRSLRPFLATMLLGLLMAAGIALLAAPEMSWLGFALAAMVGPGGPRRS